MNRYGDTMNANATESYHRSVVVIASWILHIEELKDQITTKKRKKERESMYVISTCVCMWVLVAAARFSSRKSFFFFFLFLFTSRTHNCTLCLRKHWNEAKSNGEMENYWKPPSPPLPPSLLYISYCDLNEQEREYEA